MDYKRRTQSKVSAEEANALSKSNQVSEKAKRVRTSRLTFLSFCPPPVLLGCLCFFHASQFVFPCAFGVALPRYFWVLCSPFSDLVGFSTLFGSFVILSLQSPVFSDLTSKQAASLGVCAMSSRRKLEGASLRATEMMDSMP
jgi:hypothetical protein